MTLLMMVVVMMVVVVMVTAIHWMMRLEAMAVVSGHVLTFGQGMMWLMMRAISGRLFIDVVQLLLLLIVLAI